MTPIRKFFKRIGVGGFKRRTAFRKNSHVDCLTRTHGGKIHHTHCVKNLSGALFPEELELSAHINEYALSNAVEIRACQQIGNVTIYDCRFNLFEYPELFKSFGTLCFVIEISITSDHVVFEMYDVRRLYEGQYTNVEGLLMTNKKNVDRMTLAVVINNLWEHLRAAASYIPVQKRAVVVRSI